MLTQEQQKKLDQLKNAYADSVAAYNEAVRAYTDAFNNAQDCQRKRDAVSGGVAKNKACHIDTLNALNSYANEKARERDAKENAMALNKQTLDNYIKAINDEAAAAGAVGAAALASNPEFQLAQQNVQLQAQIAQLNAQTQSQIATAQTQAQIAGAAQNAKTVAEENEKRRKLIVWSIIAFVALVLIVLAFIFIPKWIKKAKS